MKMPNRPRVREVLDIISEESELSNLPVEVQQRDEFVSEQMQDILDSYGSEIQRIEGEKELIAKLPILKQKFIYLYCSGQYKHKEIARILGVHPGTIGSWLQIEEVRNAIEAYQREENIIVDSALKAIRIRAVNKLAELLDANNELVQMQATKEILDRTGHQAIQKQEINVNLSYEEKLKKLIVEDADFTVVDDTEQNKQGE
jgi:transposase-like protein